MIGILMPSITFKHEINHSSDNDSIFNQYRLLALKHQADICMYSYKELRKNVHTVEALIYSCKQDTLMQKVTSIPKVNIVRNTSYVRDQWLIDRLEVLRSQNFLFINLPLLPQANKLHNYEYLNSIDFFKNHVPPVKRLSLDNLNTFIELYGKVIIKPIYGSKGRGITIIAKKQNEYQIYQTSGKIPYNHSGSYSNQKTTSIPHSQIKLFFTKNFCKPESFLVQKWIPFKEYSSYPYDIRAVTQKNGKNKWQLTSRVARVAHGKGQITNLSQGGEMVSLSCLLHKEYTRNIRKFALKTAKAFETLYPWTAEMGIDLAIDKYGKIWYIETNFCPEKVKWSTIYQTPFEYAYYIHTK